MKLYSENKDYKLYQGSMLDMLEIIEPNTIDSVVCDPPYELNFMGKGWDNSGIAFQPDTWKKCYEVLKPGGYLLAFGGSRTFHRIACAIEDAGFEIRDTIMWLYGSGFPKSMDISKQIDKSKGLERKVIGMRNPHLDGGLRKHTSPGQFLSSGNNRKYVKDTNNGLVEITEPACELSKQWQGWGTALKPSFEPIIVARKPFKGSLVDNIIEYGVGGINIDECRVGNVGGVKKVKIIPNSNSKNCGFGCNGELEQLNKGRFPANTILTYDETDFDEVCGGFPYTKTGSRKAQPQKPESWNAVGIKFKMTYACEGSEGSASRYFYCAKASKKDRDEGIDEFEEVDGGSYQFRQDGSLDGKIPVRKNTHPTVKPTTLMQYLVRLVTPNGGTILDPFNGSGSTGKAVMYENKERNKNYKYIGIELTEEYLPIAKARIEYVCKLNEEKLKEMQTSIFDYLESKGE
jgi:site-specific DNA-methyltransferase (adenine-specific)